MKFKRKRLKELESLITLFKDIKNTKMSYMLFYNNKKITSEIEMIQKSFRQPIPEAQEYEQKRIKLCVEFSKKDDDNKPIINNDIYLIDNLEDFNLKLKELQDFYKIYIEEQEIINKENIEFLDEEIEIDFYKIKFDVLPLDLTPSQLNLLLDFEFVESPV